jgi:hypothetical protein
MKYSEINKEPAAINFIPCDFEQYLISCKFGEILQGKFAQIETMRPFSIFVQWLTFFNKNNT